VGVLRIDRDRQRFRQILRGRIKKDLRRYMSTGELIGRRGRELVSIPVPRMDIPRFTFGPSAQGGIGQGEGGEGTPIDGDEGEGRSGAGDSPGQHLREVEITLAELAELMGEERHQYTGISRSGPESLRHFRRTYRAALRRQLMSGTYDPNRPIIVPVRDDRRYRSFQLREEPRLNAVVVYLMDVSGSMGDEQKEIVRIESFWIDTWLRHHYRDLKQRYVVHDAIAHEVDRDTFYRVKESGGTKISSAYEMTARFLHKDYSPSDWNIYVFHFSDGDNWGEGDTERCLGLLREVLLPAANLFGYGQVASPYGTGQFIKDLNTLGPPENLILSEISGRDGVYDSIKLFLGKGK
jgi:uncharacterized sporulation protein YeaH/YhbH (DUF444 family)